MVGGLQPHLDLTDEFAQSRGQGLLKQMVIHGPQGGLDPVLRLGLEVTPEAVAPPCVRNDKKLAFRPIVIGSTSHDGVS
jgi:hypothetical protein